MNPGQDSGILLIGAAARRFIRAFGSGRDKPDAHWHPPRSTGTIRPMSGGGTGGSWWIKLLLGGTVCILAAHSIDSPGWLVATLLAVGGLGVVFAACESLLLGVDGIGRRARWNPFVAGTMGGLASNLPEIVMLGFILAAEPRVGFLVVMFTLHVGALAFGVYSGLLPRDATGHARLPAPLVQLSTDLYACAAAIFLSMGLLMLSMRVFAPTGADVVVPALTPADLYVVGGILLAVEVVAIWRLVYRFSGTASASAPAQSDDAAAGEPVPSVRRIVWYGLVGVVGSVFGGHAVGDFAAVLVTSLNEAGYSEMVSALVLSVFACAGAYAMVASAHRKGMFDIALANVSGAITQVPFLVLPISLIMIAAFTQLGVVPGLPGGGALVIDLQTTSVVLLAFPPLLILWKAIQDDASVNWLETATMTAIFAVTIYFLAVHG